MSNTELQEAVADLYAAWQDSVQEKGGVLWLGFSGGVDSTALLLALLGLREDHLFELRCIHVNHDIHPQAQAWAAHCEEFCKRHDVTVEQCRVSLPASGNLEANARAARYASFAKLVDSNDSLWLAHHRNDQFETGLLRLLQGRGMLQIRRYQQIAQLTVLRPLLAFDKSDLARIVSDAGETWVEDESNADLSFDRNYLRQRVIPDLLERWPHAPDRIAASIARADDTRQAFRQTLAAMDEVSPAMIPTDASLAIAWLQVFLESRGCFHATSLALAEFKRQLDRGQRARVSFGDGSGLAVSGGLLCYRRPD